jgi:O-antigen ligase
MIAQPATSAALRRPASSEKDRSFRVIVLFWGMIILSFLSVRQRDAEDLWKPGGIDLQAQLQAAAWVGFALVALLLVAKRSAEVKLLLYAPLTWFAIYAGLAVFSTLYSVSPLLTLFRSGQVVIVILFVISLRENLRRCYFLIAVYLAANWVLILMANTGLTLGMDWVRGPDNSFMLYDRQTPYPWRFGSPLGHPSQISVVGAAAAAGLMARFRGVEFRRHLPLFLFFVVTVLLTVSRTAVAGMFVGALVVLAVRGRIIPFLLLSGIVLPLTILLPSVGGAMVDYGMRGQSTEEFKSLTGRSEIYQQGIERARDAIPLGEGFVAGRAKSIVQKDLGGSIVHSHNLFIESTIGMGVMGLISSVMVLLTLGMSLCRAVKIPPDSSGISPGWEPLVMAIPMVAFCILDRGFAGSASPALFLFVVILTYTTKLLLDHRTAWAGHTINAQS